VEKRLLRGRGLHWYEAVISLVYFGGLEMERIVVPHGGGGDDRLPRRCCSHSHAHPLVEANKAGTSKLVYFVLLSVSAEV